MMSYTFNPSRPTRPKTPPSTDDHTAGMHRRFEVMDEDVITLDYLIGVMLIKDDYFFVQYEPTDRHKRSAGLKTAPVQQINMFTTTLRDNSVMFESAMCTFADQRTLWIRVQLADLTELSLEPLWMIKGRVQLYAKQRCIAIAIHNRDLGELSLDSNAALLVESRGVERESSPCPVPPRAGDKRAGDHNQPYTDGEPTSKKHKKVPERNNATSAITRQHKTKCNNTRTRFIMKGRTVHRYKTRNAANTAAVEVPLVSPAADDPVNAESQGDSSLMSSEDTPDGTDSGARVTYDEQPSAVSTRAGHVQADVSRPPPLAKVDARPALRDNGVRGEPEPRLPVGDPSRQDHVSTKDKHRSCLLM